MFKRVWKLAGSLEGSGLDAILVLQPENRLYLSGFTGSSGALLVTGEKAYLITDFRYLEQAKEQSPHLEIVRMQETLPDTLAAMQEKTDLRSLGFEADYINFKLYRTLQEKLAGVELRPVEGIIERFRLVKDSAELAAIQRSMALLDEGFAHICGYIKPGMSESEIGLELEMFLRRRGAQGTAFPFIIASGPRASLPHGVASERTIRPGDVITMDFGVVLDFYNSDMTRTVALGKPPDKIKEIYDIVLEAQMAGLAAVKAGVPACAVDKAARDVIELRGYGDYFGHSTGHGVGLAVHEGPRLSSRDDTVLQEGMVVTVEPGVYLPGVGGVRIEDSVVVERGGCRLLTHSPKDKLIHL